MGLLCAWWIDADIVRRSGQWRRDDVMAVIVFAGFVAPIFLSALLCALLVMRRQKELFTLEPRLELEMNLPPFSRRLLRGYLPTVLKVTVFSLILSWLLWASASWFNWPALDVLAWLPPDRKSGWQPSWTISSSDLAVPLGYCAFLTLLCALGWFCKWRWGTAERAKAVTHGGLRWWKESLGAYLIVLSWLYLGLGLASLPSRAAAERHLEALLTKGEIAVLVLKR